MSERNGAATGPLSLSINAEALRPLVKVAVEEALAAALAARAELPGDKLAFGEAEAARLLSLAQHQLRDERLRGRITASVGPGKRILYRREDLAAYLVARRWRPKVEE
jgi:hypothetical protein